MQRTDRTSKSKGKEPKQRGVVAVELAVMLPVMILLIMGIVDLGLLARQHQIVQNAAREGARFSSLPKNSLANPTVSEADLKARVIDYCLEESVTLDAADISVDQNFPILVNGVQVRSSRITISRSYSFFTPGISTLFGGSVMLRGEGIFRNLY